MRYLLRVTITIMIIFIFGSLPERSSIKAQQPDSTQEPIHYKRNDNTFLESYNANDKPKYFPLDKSVNGTGVWTELNPKVPRVDYLGIHFVNKDTGWSVGAQGAILKSTDGGESWQNIISPVTNVLTNVHSFNGQEVLAVGYNGIIIRSDDRGISWQQIASGITGDLWRVQMINDTLGWACGSNSFLIRTTDAGVTWNPLYTGFSNVVLESLDFFDNNFGCIVGRDIDGGVLFKTTDGGQNWEEHKLGEYSLVSVEVFDTLRIFTGGFTRIFSTLNGGNTWATKSVDGGVNTIAFADSLTGFAGLLQGSVWKTTNGGVNWQIAAGLMPACGKYWIMFPDDSIGFTAGTALNLIKTTNKGLQWKSTVLNDDFSDVEFIDDTKGFVISNKLYKTTNGGINWNLANGAPGGSDILFLDSITGFIGNNTSIYKTIDGGENWYNTQGSGGTTKIFFINSQTGWAIGDRNIYKTIDGGNNWFIKFIAPSGFFTSIYFVDSLYGWTSGTRPYKSTDGGNNWIQQTNTNIWNTYDVCFANYNTGWFTKIQNFYKTTDGGGSWSIVSEIIGSFSFHFFPDPKHWVINGSHRYITEDGGNTFIDITDDVPTGFNSFSSITDKLGYAVGGLGLVLRYDDTSYIPVELVSFNGRLENNTILLSWQTASELNNKGFQIEKSYDKENWLNAGFVSGNGTTTEPRSYSFKDYLTNQLNSTLYYRLKQIDYGGSFEYSDIIKVEVGNPPDFFLSQNYPNPFNPETIIDYRIPEKTLVNITLYDVTGSTVKELVNEEKQPGYYTIKLKGEELSSGIYFYRIVTGSGYTATKKLTIIK
ncbi:MAG: YCF48-related protein [Ignavibacterium sp.]|nr:YCF48-related protein [Ignavibacterium sp.]